MASNREVTLMKFKVLEIVPAFVGTLFFLIVIIPFFLIFIPSKILSRPENAYYFNIGMYRYIGLVPVVLGLCIYLYCCASFVFVAKGTPIPFTPTKALIVTGLYRFVRNPLYIAGVLVLTGEGIYFQSAGLFVYCLVMFGFFNFHVLMEEAALAEKFGDAYEAYRKTVPRWIPKITPYRPEVRPENRITSDNS
jgi:protein-S-isoprenylcysteine O-methyltransferase Ste14